MRYSTEGWQIWGQRWRSGTASPLEERRIFFFFFLNKMKSVFYKKATKPGCLIYAGGCCSWSGLSEIGDGWKGQGENEPNLWLRKVFFFFLQQKKQWWKNFFSWKIVDSAATQATYGQHSCPCLCKSGGYHQVAVRAIVTIRTKRLVDFPVCCANFWRRARRMRQNSAGNTWWPW